MKKHFLLVAIALCVALICSTSNAQTFQWRLFGWSRATCSTCSTCRGGVCQTQTVENAPGWNAAEPEEPCDPCGACETCQDVETCEDCPLTALESELVKEAIRVRGSARLRLKFDALCNRRAQYNANAQASYCRLGHFSGDSNEIAGRGYTSARAAIQGWLGSPAHRAILLRSDYCKVGACVRRGRDGLLYWSMNFSR